MNKSEWLEAVSSLGCVVCGARPVSVHHIEDVRDENSDYATVALCHEHHQGSQGVHHLSRRGFEMRFKLSQLDLLKLTIRTIAKGL